MGAEGGAEGPRNTECCRHYTFQENTEPCVCHLATPATHSPPRALKMATPRTPVTSTHAHYHPGTNTALSLPLYLL